jgi:hypothetical protein
MARDTIVKIGFGCDEDFVQVDRRWFQEHPGRRYYVRWTMPSEKQERIDALGEMVNVPGAMVTVVSKVNDHLRTRLFCGAVLSKKVEEVGEKEARWLFRFLYKEAFGRYPRGGKHG